jgi:dUTP pyrophosphatase
VEEIMKLRVKLLRPEARPPKKALPGDAAFDLYTPESGSVNAFSTRTIPIGIATEFPENFVALVKTRSSLGKKGITTLAGVVDSGYRGEWAIVLHNLTGSTFHYQAGDRIAQVLFLPVESPEVIEVASLTESVRGNGGFGSTDVCSASIP